MGIFDIFTNDNAQNAANAQIAGVNAGYNQLSQLFGQAGGALNTNYTAAAQPFLQNYGTATAGTTALGNALGLNGAAGNAAATQSFWNNPAISSAINTGSQNVLRNQAATGQLNSGATNIDLQNVAQQTASQGWNQYIAQLQPYLGASTSAASGIGNVYTGLGSQLANLYQNQGNAAYGAQTSIGNANANADLANNNASANIWNALMGGAKLATSAAAMFSDERLKEDIEPVGELYDGTNVYRYRYKGDSVPRIGVMAQEVEKTRPDAVVEIGGYKAVDYGKATDYAAALAPFREAA